MRAASGILVAAGAVGAGLLALFVRKSTPAGSAGSGAVSAAPAAPEELPDIIVIGENEVTGSTSGSRGIRNNNPGNIRKTGDKWQGLSATQSDPAFFQFTHAQYGVRAIGKILSNYAKVYGLKTVRQLISRWAPGHENPTGTYVSYVAAQVGVEPDATIDVGAVLDKLALAIIRFENGRLPYDPQDVDKWVHLP